MTWKDFDDLAHFPQIVLLETCLSSKASGDKVFAVDSLAFEDVPAFHCEFSHPRKCPTIGPNCSAYRSREPHATAAGSAATAHSKKHPATSASPLRSILTINSYHSAIILRGGLAAKRANSLTDLLFKRSSRSLIPDNFFLPPSIAYLSLARKNPVAYRIRKSVDKRWAPHLSGRFFLNITPQQLIKNIT